QPDTGNILFALSPICLAEGPTNLQRQRFENVRFVRSMKSDNSNVADEDLLPFGDIYGQDDVGRRWTYRNRRLRRRKAAVGVRGLEVVFVATLRVDQKVRSPNLRVHRRAQVSFGHLFGRAAKQDLRNRALGSLDDVEVKDLAHLGRRSVACLLV